MKLGWSAIIILIWFSIPFEKGFANNGQDIFFSDVVIDYQFNQHVTFEALAQPQDKLALIDEITIQIQPDGEAFQTGLVHLEDNGELNFTYEFAERKWHPFITVKFQYKITFTNGAEQTSAAYSFTYDDNRFKWQSLRQEPFHIHFQDGDLETGQIILNTALAGLQKSKNYIQNLSSAPVHVYAYRDPTNLQTAIPNHKQEWAAGYTHPSLNIIMVSAPPGPGLQLELERQIPHEITHVLINELTGGKTHHIPSWLSEGLATLSEIYPNPDNQRLLGFAVETDSLIPIESLCLALPADASDAFLAYAESGSFVNFLFRRYGAAGMGTLLQQYANGVSCELGMIALTGDSLSNIEKQWRQQVLGMDTKRIGFENLLPYLTFLVITLVPLISVVFIQE